MNRYCMRTAVLSAALVLLGELAAPRVWAQGCSLDHWADDIITAWNSRSMLTNAPCYAGLIKSMDQARALRDQVVARFDQMYPRAAYKVVGLDPVNAALDGVDRPMVGVMYVSMFYPNGMTIPMSSAAKLITEPDILFSVADDGINDATTLEEAMPHLDRAFAFIEVLGPLFNNSPANPYLMQASDLMARSGVIGESVKVRPTEQFLHSLETMRVTFVDGKGKILADVPGSYLGRNPMNGVLVVIRELRRLGQRLQPGDLISAGSFMPPMPVTKDLYTETVYEGMGGTTLKVSAWYR